MLYLPISVHTKGYYFLLTKKKRKNITFEEQLSKETDSGSYAFSSDFTLMVTEIWYVAVIN